MGGRGSDAGGAQVTAWREVGTRIKEVESGLLERLTAVNEAPMSVPCTGEHDSNQGVRSGEVQFEVKLSAKLLWCCSWQ